MIAVEDVNKQFGTVHALRNINLEIPSGGITALIGPNASGKTTLLKMIMGYIRPGTGRIFVFGQDIATSLTYRENIGYMSQYSGYPENLKVGEVIQLVKTLRKCGESGIGQLFDIFNLQDFINKPVNTLSGGTRQKLSAYVTTMFDPPLLILDEPTASLDPFASIALKDYLLRKSAEGKSVVITSHNIHELEEIADRIVFMQNGKLAFTGTSTEMKKQTGEETLERAIASIIGNGGFTGD